MECSLWPEVVTDYQPILRHWEHALWYEASTWHTAHEYLRQLASCSLHCSVCGIRVCPHHSSCQSANVLNHNYLTHCRCFEIVVIIFQLRAANTNTKDNIPAEPDLSISRACSDFAFFVPGVSASLLIFVVFGTTRSFRDYIWTKFAPKALQNMVANKKARQGAKSIQAGKSMTPPVVLSTIQVGVKRNSRGAANTAVDDDFKGAQTLTTINGQEYRTGQYTNFIDSATPSPTVSPGPGSVVDLEAGNVNGNGHGNGNGHNGFGYGNNGSQGGYGGNGRHMQVPTTTSFGVSRSVSGTEDDVPILKKAMPTFQRHHNGYR